MIYFLPATEPLQLGVGFVIKRLIASKFESLPKNINDRLMYLRLPLKYNRYATLISPTLTRTVEEKESFYCDLDHLTVSTPLSDKLIIMGDFNARVGRSATWHPVIGNHGIESDNKQWITFTG